MTMVRPGKALLRSGKSDASKGSGPVPVRNSGQVSLLSEDLQLPLCKLLIAQMEAKGEFPKLPKGSVTPTIITGMDALGRNHDVARLSAFMQQATQFLGPELVQQYIDASDLLTRLAAGMGIDSKGLVKGRDEVQQQQQAAQQQQMAQTVAPHVVKGAADMMKQAQAAQGSPDGTPTR